MKVLHIWSVAGVSSLIARYMDSRHGTESDIIITEKRDQLGLNDYRTTRMKSKPLFGLKALIMARKYDLIHVHYHSIFIPCLKFLYKKPVIIHFHGSDVRENWGARLGRIKRADAILVSTKDLLQGAPLNAFWVPNPVDTVKFKTRDPSVECLEKAFTFSYGADDEAYELANRYDLHLDIIEEKIQYDQVPELMNEYSFYIDIKRDFKGRILYDHGAMSKSGLEALAMGLKVVSKDMSVREGLPEAHRPENVADIWFGIYEKLRESYL